MSVAILSSASAPGCVVLGPYGEGRRRQSGGKGQQFGGVCGTGDGASHPVSSTSAVVRWGRRGAAGAEEQEAAGGCHYRALWRYKRPPQHPY